MKIWEPKQPPGTLWATPGLLWDCFIFLEHYKQFYKYSPILVQMTTMRFITG